jgi:mannose/fructose/N-acetylgalactosamine-specific phosphotransferase system component IID
MAMRKSIGRTLAQIDVAANTLVRIHEDFFNSHPMFSTVIWGLRFGKSAHVTAIANKRL